MSYFVKLARAPRVLRLLRMVRLLRLLKLAHLKGHLAAGYFSSRKSSNVIQLARIFAGLTAVAHFSGSIWYLLAAFSWEIGPGRASQCEGDSANWVQAAGLCDETNNTKLYLMSVYWSFTTLSTVGYGDISAKSMWELGFSLVMMMFGVAFYSAIAGTVINMISAWGADQKEMNGKRDKLRVVTFF
jgi:hypothetical protein